MYTVKLVNANIASFDFSLDSTGKLTETISLTYEKIIWTWNDGGNTTSDDWEVRV